MRKGSFGAKDPRVAGRHLSTMTRRILLPLLLFCGLTAATIAEPLVGKLLTYDALEQDFRQLKLRRNPDCPACGDRNQPPAIVEYDDLCMPAGTVARTS